MKFLLRFRPWQLFLLFLGAVIIPPLSVSYILIEITFSVIYFGWIYSIGTYMHKLIPDKRKPKINYFTFNSLFMIIAIALSALILQMPGWLQIPLSLYVFWCWFYTAMFAARMLESMIEGELVGNSDSIKGFVCILFFPFGVWQIQPAVHRVLNKYGV